VICACAPNADGHSARGRVQEALGDVAKALVDYDRAAELDPHDVVARVRRLALRASGSTASPDREHMAAEIEKLAEDLPDLAAIQELLATLHSARGDGEGKALAAWDRAIELAGAGAAGSSYLARAVEHARMGHVQEAFDDASRAVERSPDLVGGWVARGIYRTHLEDDCAAALGDLDRAVSLSPDDGAARLHRGQIRMLTDDYEGALEDLDRAVAIAPKAGQLYAERALCREQLGDDDGAEADRARARELGYEPDEEELEEDDGGGDVETTT
jgi:tetratricopeptide (TPR) repeat protein